MMNPRILELLNQPLTVESKDLFLLEDEIEQYPYFQPLHLLSAKAVATSEDEKFSSVLNKTATYCANRIILFEYLNKKNPQPVQQPSTIAGTTDQDVREKLEQSSPAPTQKDLSNEQVNPKDALPPTQSTDDKTESEIDSNFSQKINTTKGTSTEEISETETSTPSIHLKDRHSFGEWLSLKNQPSTSGKKEVVNKKFKIIEDFLEKNPKISPAKVYKPSVEINNNSKENLSHLMTETLAKIYVEQNKFDKAIKAYTILRLKYPEKSGYFADRIKEIKDLKNN